MYNENAQYILCIVFMNTNQRFDVNVTSIVKPGVRVMMYT